MPSLQNKTKSLSGQKVAAYLKLAQENESIWGAILVFLGALFLLGTFPFYAIYIIPLLALICGGVAFRNPKLGVILGMLLAFPAVAYQSVILSWIFALFIAITLFEVFEHWIEIAYVEIIILAPFSFGHLPFLGWMSILGMIIGALHFGSKKSLMISVPSVFVILLLSSIWGIENSAFLPLYPEQYKPLNEDLTIAKEAVSIIETPGKIAFSISELLNFAKLSGINEGLSTLFGNIWKILFLDSGLMQLIAWSVMLYAMAFLSGQIKGRISQFLSSLVAFAIVPVYYLISLFIRNEFKIELIFAITASCAVVGILEYFGVKISHEMEERRRETAKSFGKFGLQDMGLEGEEKSLDDIGNYEDVKQELRDSILLPLEKKELVYTYGIKPPSGILLFGPPGTGKTMLMRALAKELKYGFYYIKSSQILSQWFGESERNISEIFSIARSKAPSILFFDEIDSIGKKRTSYSADDVGPRILSILLQEMDGLKTGKPVLVVGATNAPHQLDPALLRPGRFDKIIYMHLPEREARLEIFRAHCRKIPLAEDVNFEVLAKKTDRFSGADIKNVVQEAIKMAAKEATRTGAIVPINIGHFLSVLRTIKPSVGLAQIEDYERFKLDFERRTGAKEEAKPKEEITSWEDVAGLDDIKQSLLETIELPLLHEKEMKELKVKPTKGILLFGPPGTGKTLIVKAASNELKASFQSISAAEMMKQGYTQAVTVIKETFNRARENTPAIIFIDEVETFAPARGRGSEEILGQFLAEMDGLKELKGVIVMAATNKPGMLDPAMLRPGRFDKIFYIPPPDEKGREDIFRIHLGKLASGIDLKQLASASNGFSGADIAGVCQEVKLSALRSRIAGKEIKISTDDILAIIKRRRPSVTSTVLREFEQFLEEYGERR